MLSLTRTPGEDINCYHPNGDRLNIHLDKASHDFIVINLNDNKGLLLDANVPYIYHNLGDCRIEIYLIRIRCSKYVQIGIKAHESIKILRGEIDEIWSGYVNKL